MRKDEHQDPLSPWIQKIINTMKGKLEQPPPTGSSEGALRSAAGGIDAMAERLAEIERCAASVEDSPVASPFSEAALVRHVRDRLSYLAELLRFLDVEREAPVPTVGPSSSSWAVGLTDLDERWRWNAEVQAFLTSLTPPGPAGETADGLAAAARVTLFCEVLADLAACLAILANVVTGSISLAIQGIAKNLRAPLIATGTELSLAAAKEFTGGKLRAEVTGQQCAEQILRFDPIGSTELKVTAFLLRLTGVVTCLIAGIRPVERCPCYPDGLSDVGGAAIGASA